MDTHPEPSLRAVWLRAVDRLPRTRRRPFTPPGIALSPAERRTAHALADSADVYGRAAPGVEFLADRAGCHRDRVRIAIHKLERAGLLTRAGTWTSGRPDVFQLRLPPRSCSPRIHTTLIQVMREDHD